MFGEGTHDESYWNEELETKPWPEMERWQAERVAGFVSQLRARSPFYAERLAEADAARVARSATPESIASLPFVTKAVVRDAQAASVNTFLGSE